MHQAHQHQLPPASSSTVPPQKRSFISSAVLALSAVLGCSLLTLLPPFHAAQTIFATAFIPAVLVSAWYGGIGLGLLATALSSAFMVYFVLEPVHSFAIKASEDLARIVAFAVVGVSVSFVVAFQRRIRDASLENAERLRTTLESIGDAVIVTDNSGRITSMNAVAERLTGWLASETAGRPLRTVFHIIHESSRHDVLEPGNADRNPLMISVPDRSMLVSRDGKEYPIETSISLIKEASKVYGVVLVFRDVSAQRQHQREMEETARRLREIAGERQVLLNREQAARAQAEAANQMKDDFLAMVSHELRTPLTSIVGWAAVLRDKRAAPEALHMGLSSIERNAKLQIQLVEDLLDVTRIAAGSFRLERRPVDVNAAITTAINSLRVAADEKHIAVSFRAQPCPAMDLDPNRFQQVLWNLLSNAIKFTPSSGKIDVTTSMDGELLRVEVTDDGQGFSPDFQSRLFKRFQQEDRNTSRNGLGLGLSIVRQIVELHGGTIEGHSRGLNKGATFVVTLPVTADTAMPNDSLDNAQSA